MIVIVWWGLGSNQYPPLALRYSTFIAHVESYERALRRIAISEARPERICARASFISPAAFAAWTWRVVCTAMGQRNRIQTHYDQAFRAQGFHVREVACCREVSCELTRGWMVRGRDGALDVGEAEYDGMGAGWDGVGWGGMGEVEWGWADWGVIGLDGVDWDGMEREGAGWKGKG